MQTAITILIVAGAALALIRKGLAVVRGKASGCGHCGQSGTCGAKAKDDSCASFQAFPV